MIGLRRVSVHGVVLSGAPAWFVPASRAQRCPVTRAISLMPDNGVNDAVANLWEEISDGDKKTGTFFSVSSALPS